MNITMIDRNTRDLAREFGVDERTMKEFVGRFSPKAVKANAYTALSDTMLFVHIPKTAGLSIGKSFHSTFDNFYGVQWDNIKASFRQQTRSAIYNQSRKDVRQVIMGHFGWPEIQLWKNHEMAIKCGTIFRDPVQRMISNFNYNSSDVHPGHAAFNERFSTVESYVRETGLDVQITQAVGLISSFEEALTKLIRYYTFIGVTEMLPASLDHLAKSHGLRKMHEHRENIGSNKAATVSDEVAELIRRRSHNDLKLHRLLMALYRA